MDRVAYKQDASTALSMKVFRNAEFLESPKYVVV